jgi:hypothetical protein
MTINELKKRYFRVVMNHPKGVFTHSGDCSRYYCGVCDCGLFHYLEPYLSGKDENLRKAIYKILYKDYDLDYDKHRIILEAVYKDGWGEKVWEEAKDYMEKNPPPSRAEFRKMMKDLGFKIDE